MTTATAAYQPFPRFADWSRLRVDEDTVDRFFALLSDLRHQAGMESLDRAVRTATRFAAIDTGAIEGLYDVDRGFTITVATEAAGWEAVLAAREPAVRRSFEDALGAYDFVLDMATSRTPISEKAIREIHQRICASQQTYRVHTSVGVQDQPLPKGVYKRMPNNPVSLRTGRSHHYTPPLDVPAEMARLVVELRSEQFQQAHPVLEAAYAHYSFVAVHPFADGNGRVARALASVFLYRRPGVPLVVFADQKDAYIDALEEADAGRPQRFVAFIQERTEDVIELVRLTTARRDRPPAGASLASLREALVGDGGPSAPELDALALRARDEAVGELRRRVEGLNLPTDVQVVSPAVRPGTEPTASYRPVPGAQFGEGVQVEAVIGGAPVSTATVTIGVRVRKQRADGPVFELVSDPDGDVLPVELRDVHPTVGQVFTVKLDAWVAGLVERTLARLDTSLRRTLTERGYR